MFCELSVAGDKILEHQDYCGSKTRKCPECNQNITMREFEEHKYNGKCNFLKEIEQGKALRELAKFQEEQKKELDMKTKMQ